MGSSAGEPAPIHVLAALDEKRPKFPAAAGAAGRSWPRPLGPGEGALLRAPGGESRPHTRAVRSRVLVPTLPAPVTSPVRAFPWWSRSGRRMWSTRPPLCVLRTPAAAPSPLVYSSLSPLPESAGSPPPLPPPRLQPPLDSPCHSPLQSSYRNTPTSPTPPLAAALAGPSLPESPPESPRAYPHSAWVTSGRRPVL